MKCGIYIKNGVPHLFSGLFVLLDDRMTKKRVLRIAERAAAKAKEKPNTTNLSISIAVKDALEHAGALVSKPNTDVIS
ncbi:hypothetical protein HYT04_00700 [Candidatus Kaiserbacteria bacterium]|nr:hypothetical protein [Candidatus Kaiserbacteria bacterium]